MALPRMSMATTVCVLLLTSAAFANTYPWMKGEQAGRCIASAIPVPDGYRRIDCDTGSFADWLRHLPLKPKGAPVLLHNGKRKNRQDVHAAVIDIDTGRRDLQQCADAVMRLRAEYLYSKEDFPAIHFNFTSGDKATFVNWAAGQRPVVKGNTVRWVSRTRKDASYTSFRSFMDTVFIYAGSASLSKELAALPEDDALSIGDVYIQGGFPGHAVLVVDVAQRVQSGERIFLLAQSYMPAQEVHILKNPENATLSPWYKLPHERPLQTPEWTFKETDLKRFPSK